MASATSASNYFFTEPHAERLNERKESTASSVSNKSIDNPLLGRDPPSIVTTSTKDIISTTYNNNELRHRRPSPSVIFREDKENVQINPSVLNNGTSTKSFHGAIPPPPRASISLGTALEGPLGVVSSNAAYRPPNRSISTPVASSSTSRELVSTTERSLVPTAHNCWVLGFGYATAEQYQELLQHFSLYGHVVDHCGLCRPGHSNWIAIQYASELEAKKALCHSVIELSNDIYCGVKPLADDDAIQLHRKNNPHIQNGADLWGQRQNENGTKPAPLKSAEGETERYPKAGLTENDILLVTRDGPQRRESNLCDRLVRWLLGIPQYD